MIITLGLGEVTIETGWVSEKDDRRAVFIEPAEIKGEVGAFTGSVERLEPLKKGGLMLVIDKVEGAETLRDTLNYIINEMIEPNK